MTEHAPDGPEPTEAFDEPINKLRDEPIDESPEDTQVHFERPAPEPTGHPAVDEVLRSLGELDGKPVSEHVAVFEQAHEALREALADARDSDPRD